MTEITLKHLRQIIKATELRAREGDPIPNSEVLFICNAFYDLCQLNDMQSAIIEKTEAAVKELAKAAGVHAARIS